MRWGFQQDFALQTDACVICWDLGRAPRRVPRQARSFRSTHARHLGTHPRHLGTHARHHCTHPTPKNNTPPPCSSAVYRRISRPLCLATARCQELDTHAEISANPQICNRLAVRQWIHFWGLGLGFAKCQNLCQGRRLKNGHGKVSRTRHTCQNLCQPPNLQLACSKTMDPLLGVSFRFFQMPKISAKANA